MSALPRSEDELFSPMSARDLDEVMIHERELYSFPWTQGNFADSLSAGYSAWTLRDARGELIAYAISMIAPDEAHILNLSVARRFQRFGFGWRMLDWLAAHARDFGCRSMLLEVRPSNVAAQRLYRRYGFEPIGLRRGYYPADGGREDALVMRIAL